VESTAFSPDKTRVITLTSDGYLRLWQTADGSTMPAPSEYLHSEATRISLSADGEHALIINDAGVVHIMKFGSRYEEEIFLQHRKRIKVAVFSLDGARIVTGGEDGVAQVWDATTGKPLIEHPGRHPDAVPEDNSSMEVRSRDRRRVIVTTDPTTAQVMYSSTRQPVSSPLQHRNKITSMAFSPDGDRVVTACNDGIVQVWDVRGGNKISPSLPHEHGIGFVAFSPDGSRVVTGSYDGTSQIWNARTGVLEGSILRHRGSVLRIVFNLDGTRVATASADQTARIWDARTGEGLTPWLEHGGHVVAASFSPDGTRLVTASGDGFVHIWDTNSGERLVAPFEVQGTPLDVTFSADGTRVIATRSDLSTQEWKTPLDQGTLHDWEAIAMRCPYVLVNGFLYRREQATSIEATSP
jgi:WD40 repeat protein